MSSTPVHHQINADVLVIGAGIIGLSTAYELLLRGRNVLVVDRHTPAQAGSRQASGILSPLRPWAAHPVVDRLARYSQLLYPDFVTAIEEKSSLSVEYAAQGMLVVGADHVVPAQNWATSTGESVQVMQRPAMLKQIADLGRFHTGVWLESVAQLRTPLLLRALEHCVRQAGGQILLNNPITQIELAKGRLGRVFTEAGKIRADQVIIAAGAWSGAIPGLEALRLGVRPVRGQMIWLQDHPSKAPRPILDDGEHFVVTREDGVTLIGEIVENSGFDQRVTSKALKRLENKAKNLIRSLANLPVQGHWAGLRPARAHGIPLIGACPTVERLFFNTGHFHNGLTLTPGSAALLADLMEGQNKPGVGVATL